MDNGQWTCVAKRLSCIFLSIVSNEKLMAFCFTVRSYKRNMKRTLPYKIHNVILDRAKSPPTVSTQSLQTVSKTSPSIVRNLFF